MKFITNTSDLAKFLNKKIKFNAQIKSISTDTRLLKKNSLFIAIKGENFDGNNFVDDAPVSYTHLTLPTICSV